MRTLVLLVCGCLVASTLTAQQLCGKPVEEKWWTVPERSSWQKTSTSKEVETFLARLHAAHPDAFQLTTMGKTREGRAMQLAIVRRKAGKGEGKAKRLRALIIANIHAGEVEGKEAVQVILREIALGQHEEILKACDVWFVPIFNVDGNDAVDVSNRRSQNGPTGVGRRTNSRGLDLNRDFVKAESAEVKALLGVMRREDPHLFMDLHTTNGSPHGYHLTYSPSLSTNLDADLDAFMHERFNPAVREAMRSKHGFRIFDYGNFPRRRSGQPGSQPGIWTTYDHRPRYGINYFGLRNRLSLLSEAYSYLPFRQRALVTRAFVLETLRQAVHRKAEILRLCADADRRLLDGGLRFGHGSERREPVRGKVLVGSVSREETADGRGRRRIASADHEEVEMDISVRFVARKFVAYPRVWAIVGGSSDVRQVLLIHGVEVEELLEEVELEAESFQVESVRRQRLYQGHRSLGLRGKLVAGKHRLPKGTLVVRARQGRGRVAAQLLEGQSEDSLAVWNFFDDHLVVEGDTEEPVYPVLRLMRLPTLPTLKTKQLFLEKGG